MFIISSVIGLILMFAIPAGILHALFSEEVASRILSVLTAAFISIYIYCMFVIVGVLMAFLAGVDIHVLEITIIDWYNAGTISQTLFDSGLNNLVKILLFGYVMFIDAWILAFNISMAMLSTFSLVFIAIWIGGLIATWHTVGGMVKFAFHIPDKPETTQPAGINLGGPKV